MRVIEKISLTIFSVLVLVFSLVLSLMLFNWLDAMNVYVVIQYLKSSQVITNTTLITLIILMLLAIKCIFFPADSKSTKEERIGGILLENESGKLLISVQTIENLVKGVVASFQNIKIVNCQVKLDKQINNVIIDLNLVVMPDTIIKEISTELQVKIKEVIKTATEIEVKQININIKNIETKKEV